MSKLNAYIENRLKMFSMTSVVVRLIPDLIGCIYIIIYILYTFDSRIRKSDATL